MPAPANVTAAATAGGSLATGTYYFTIVALEVRDQQHRVGRKVSRDCSTAAAGTRSACRVPCPGTRSYRIYQGVTAGGEDCYQTTTATAYLYGSDSGAVLNSDPPAGLHDSPVSSISIAFSQPVSGFTPGMLELTLNGANVPLTGATLTSSDDQNWTLGNLAGLTYAGGTYQLTLAAAGPGVTDAFGAPLAGNASTIWVMCADILQGTPAGSDAIRVVADPADPTTTADVYINNSTTTPSYTVPMSQAAEWAITGSTDDQVTLDFSNGSPISQYGSAALNGVATTLSAAVGNDPNLSTDSDVQHPDGRRRRRPGRGQSHASLLHPGR